ncbi:MAG: alpha/beta hydrolase [Pseudomonadota bacterium]
MIRRGFIGLGLATAFATGWTSWRAARNDAQAEADYPPLGRILDVNGVPVHVLTLGSGPPFVMIHGAGGNMRDFTLSLAGQMAATNTVVLFDRPGHGYTGTIHNRGESPTEQAALLAAALGQIGIKRAIIGGYSIGGAVALAWALNHPQTAAGLLLMNAVSNPWEIPPSYLYDLAAGRLTGPVFNASVSAFTPQSMIEDTLTSIFAPNPVPPGYVDHIGIGLSVRRSQLTANGRQVTTLLPHIKEQSKKYPALKLPIEMITGAQDVSIPPEIHAEQLIKQVPHATYVKVPGVGHSTHHYAQTEVLAALGRLTCTFD